jgi:hypothetical protein
MILGQLDLLTPAELIILEQHLKLGTSHLKQHLSENELERMLSSIPANQITKIKQSDTEISGNLSLVLNTIFTATFGSWLGYSGFWGISLASYWAFGSTITIVTTLGVLIGCENIRSTKQQVKTAIKDQTLNLLQLEILKKIDQKRREEIVTIGIELNELLLNLSLGTVFEKKICVLNLVGKSIDEISEWAAKVDAMGKEKLAACLSSLVCKAGTDEWMELQEELKQNSISFFKEKGELGIIHFESLEKKEDVYDSCLKKLINTSPKKSKEPPSWIRSNARPLIFGLATTLLGCFSSLSVYLGGVPLILKNFGYDQSVIFLTNPNVKMVAFAMSVLLTFYFGFSFVYANWRVFKRFGELEKTNRGIIQMESSLTVMDANMLKLKEVKRSTLQLMRFFKIVDKISFALKQ